MALRVNMLLVSLAFLCATTAVFGLPADDIASSFKKIIAAQPSGIVSEGANAKTVQDFLAGLPGSILSNGDPSQFADNQAAAVAKPAPLEGDSANVAPRAEPVDGTKKDAPKVDFAAALLAKAPPAVKEAFANARPALKEAFAKSRPTVKEAFGKASDAFKKAAANVKKSVEKTLEG